MRRCLFLLIALVCGLFAVPAASAQTTPWSAKVRAGDIVYFAFAAPARIERYDLASEQWLASIPLTSAPNAFFVDGDAIYYTSGRTVLRRALDGSGERAIYTTYAAATALLTDANFIFIFSSTYSNFIVESLRKSDLQLVATANVLGGAYSIAPGQRRIYGVASNSSASDTGELPYNADGTFASSVGTGNGEPSPGKLVTWVSPDERKLIRGTGTVYSTPGVTRRDSLGLVPDDVGFHGVDVTLVLRGNTLLAFDNALLETGSYTLTSTAFGIAVRAGQVYAFGAGTNAPGIAVTKVAVSAITTTQPGAPLDPSRLTYGPADVQVMEDGSLLLFSREYQSIFRWSPSSSTYTAIYPLTSTPFSFTYSPTLRRIYTSYRGGAIKQIKLDEGATTETSFYQLPPNLSLRVFALDDFVFAAQNDSSSSFATFVIDRDGVQRSMPTAIGTGTNLLWSSSQRRLYFNSDYSGVRYVPVDVNGGFGSVVAPFSRPSIAPESLRISSDGATILSLIGSITRTSDLGPAGSLPNSVTYAFTDAASRAGKWATIRPTDGTSSPTTTLLEVWTSANTVERSFTLAGAPQRIVTLRDGRLLVLTNVPGVIISGSYYPGRLIFSFVDLAGAGTITSSPYITTPPVAATAYSGQTATLSVAAGGGGSLTYQWQHNGADIPGATGATLSLSPVQEADAGTYAVNVSNPFGSMISKSVDVVVQAPPAAPVILTQPTSSATIVGSFVTFTVQATGSAVTFQWRRAGVPIPGATSSEQNSGINSSRLSLNPISASDITTYDVVVSNPGGSVTSETATLTAAAPVTITRQPTSQLATLGGTASFTVAATSNPAPTYRWYRQAAGSSNFSQLSNNAAYSGTTTDTLMIANLQPVMTGDQFRCVVSTGFSASVTSNAATLSVSFAPAFTSAATTTFQAGVSNGFRMTAIGSPASHFTASDLPVWAALDATTGVISGIPPTSAGPSLSFQITAANGAPPNATQLFTLLLRRSGIHSADFDGNGQIDLSEIVRVIQLFNTRAGATRTGAYRVDPAGDDGFNPDPGRTAPAVLAAYHDADTDHDGKIDLLELTRVIEFYQYEQGGVRTGAYHLLPNAEAGFAPGP